MSTVTISATMVNDLRAQTGAGLLDCKKALVETNGNVEEAITILRKKGAASANAVETSRLMTRPTANARRTSRCAACR